MSNNLAEDIARKALRIDWWDTEMAARRVAEYAATRIQELEAENEKLRKGLEIYQRERDRYKHANPEMTGAYFLTGGHGPKDENGVPMYVEICPAYGCAWTYVYQTTGRTISYEGS